LGTGQSAGMQQAPSVTKYPLLQNISTMQHNVIIVFQNVYGREIWELVRRNGEKSVVFSKKCGHGFLRYF
jgi:hypothetical protein